MAAFNNFAEAIGNALLCGYTIEESEYGGDGTDLVKLTVSRFRDGWVEDTRIFDAVEMTEEYILFDRIDRCIRYDEIVHYDTESGKPELEVLVS